ncbi:hypothetical protein F4801DRAFT_46743 [Xylaria longipes]|nr:hypothetical protein F4801DRAFT_46743 [Xylaria longipes]
MSGSSGQCLPLVSALSLAKCFCPIIRCGAHCLTHLTNRKSDRHNPQSRQLVSRAHSFYPFTRLSAVCYSHYLSNIRTESGDNISFTHFLPYHWRSLRRRKGLRPKPRHSLAETYDIKTGEIPTCLSFVPTFSCFPVYILRLPFPFPISPPTLSWPNLI